MVFRNPQALSSALAALGTLQPRAFGFLNTVDPFVSVSNYYVVDSTFWLVGKFGFHCLVVFPNLCDLTLV